jgi:hypothetical protein
MVSGSSTKIAPAEDEPDEHVTSKLTRFRAFRRLEHWFFHFANPKKLPGHSTSFPLSLGSGKSAIQKQL